MLRNRWCNVQRWTWKSVDQIDHSGNTGMPFLRMWPLSFENEKNCWSIVWQMDSCWQLKGLKIWLLLLFCRFLTVFDSRVFLLRNATWCALGFRFCFAAEAHWREDWTDSADLRRMALSWTRLRFRVERGTECSTLYGSFSFRRNVHHLIYISSPRTVSRDPSRNIRGVYSAVGKDNTSNVALPGPRILFAAGGTGGHVYPALAIADEVRKLNPAAEIQFVGTKERMEWGIIPKAGYAISPIPAVAILRPFWSFANVLLPLRLLLCLWVSWRIVRKFRPDVVVGTGGYIAGPLCLMAALSGAVVAIQEQNAYAGLSNRILGRVAKVVFVAFAAATAYFPKGKCVLIGNPTRRVLQQPLDRVSALRSFFDVNLGGHEEVVVVMGGSLGARLINEAMAGIAWPLLEQNPRRYIIWQTGTINYDSTLSRVGTHPRLALLPWVLATLVGILGVRVLGFRVLRV